METGRRDTPFVIFTSLALVVVLLNEPLFAQERSPEAIHTVEFQPDDFQRTLPHPGLSRSVDHARLPIAAKEREKKPILDDDAPGGSVSMGGLVLWTALIIMFIVGGVWTIKKLFPNSRFLAQGGMINILARKQLSAKHTLLVVEVGRKVFLLADTKDNVVFIKEFADVDTVSAIKASSPLRRGESIEKSFQEALGESLTEDVGVVSVPTASETETEGDLAGTQDDGVDPDEKEKLDRLFNEVDHIRQTVKDWRNHFA